MDVKSNLLRVTQEWAIGWVIAYLSVCGGGPNRSAYGVLPHTTYTTPKGYPMVISRCGCGKCRKESEHGLGFVWELQGKRWIKRYSIKPRLEARHGYPHGVGSSFNKTN